MVDPPVRTAPDAALRLARRAWKLLNADSQRAQELACRALDAAGDDPLARPWALLVHGYNQLFLFDLGDAITTLDAARNGFDAVPDRTGHILASAGIARARWRQGHNQAALDLLLPLRDEGLQVLRGEQRGVLLNWIAGCYSVLGQSEQAFAYMFAALRDSRRRSAPGYDAALHCNLAHELLQLGDYEGALEHVEAGLACCAGLKNPRLRSMLQINRVICLSDLDRAAEAMDDVREIAAVPLGESGRGNVALHFETLAIAALRAGDQAVGATMAARAAALQREAVADEQVEAALAHALLAEAQGDLDGAERLLLQRLPMVLSPEPSDLCLRMRCSFLLALADLQERRGRAADALATLRAWQSFQLQRSKQASRARYQAAALQTELMRLQRQVDEHDARRRETERARAELEAINSQLSRKVEEVQALQVALHRQATRDALTGLFNRRFLNDTLPSMFALARRDQAPLAVAVIDLDHFKAINDTHGHAAGDSVLAAFGGLLAGSGRKSDIACRYGGEEFCLLMPRTDLRAAQRKVESLLRRWLSTTVVHEATRLHDLGFSAGVADSQHGHASADALLGAADDALLAAKRAGRRRVLAAQDPPVRPPPAARVDPSLQPEGE